MILITSGAYVIPEFQVELGKIPPCLLPLGNKKLIEFQVKALRENFEGEAIVVTLPESYVLSKSEDKILDTLNVEVVFVPDQFKLCDSLLYVLNTNEQMSPDEQLYLLHGDTYILDLEAFKLQNAISVAKSNESYNWEVVRFSPDHALVWSGFFAFSKVNYLLKALTLKRHDFVEAIHYYQELQPCQLIETKRWYDLGHANTYFNTRANITTQRAFNDLKIHDGIVFKSGQPYEKIKAEALWYEQLPSQLRQFTPLLIQHGEIDQQYSYQLEYLPYIPLNELYVHGKNERLQWNQILGKIADFMRRCGNVELTEEQKRSINQESYKLYVDKSKQRFHDYAEKNALDLSRQYIYKNAKLPSLQTIIDQCIERVLGLSIIHGVSHGDLCFSNILFDSRGDRIKVIDPRGMNFKNEYTVYGDLKYDFAKLSHSVIGLYDYIISGNYVIEESASGAVQILFDTDERVIQIQNHFNERFNVNGVSVQQIMPLVVLLFLSMLPLHGDRPDRQKAMLINALRLYKEYIYS